MAMKLVPLLLATVLALPASAATLKPFSTLSGAVVRLSDLWDGVVADRMLGPAPAPGGRITVEAPQLAAIAREFGVEWRPASGGDRAVLERTGHALGRDDLRGPLREALAGAGASRDADLEFGVFTAPPLPEGAKPVVAVQHLDFDAVSGRFAALLAVTAEGAPPSQVRVTGHMQEMIDLPVPRRRMLPGDVVGPDDLGWARLKVGFAMGEVVRVPSQAVGQALKRSAAPNEPIPLNDLGRPVVIQRSAIVTLSLEGPGLQVTAQGVATQMGGVGEVIRVLNANARTTVAAEITGPGQARVLPGTALPASPAQLASER